MNDSLELPAAEERLLDAALAQVLALPAMRRSRGMPRWFAAALMLLGVMVTAATMWLARCSTRDETQDPDTLPPQVAADGRKAIEALPPDTANLLARLLEPKDLPVLTRFRQLRRLVLVPLDVHIGPVNTRKTLPVWERPPADLLAPLAELRELESLQLSFQIAVPTASLTPLAGCRKLRDLELAHSGLVLDEPFVRALAAVPSLQQLRLAGVRVDAAACQRLASLRLTGLELRSPYDFEDAAWQQLCAMDSLASLALHDLGRKRPGAWQDGECWMPSPEQIGELRRLPRLRELELASCRVEHGHLANLPDRLESLTLRGHELTAEGFAHLRRLARLRRLELTTRRYDLRAFAEEPAAHRAACGDAVAEAIASLHLTSLHYTGLATPALLSAIARQPELRDLRLFAGRLEDLTDVARAPALQTLFVGENVRDPAMTLDVLRALAAARTLRRLEVTPQLPLDESALRAALGDRVTIVVHR